MYSTATASCSSNHSTKISISFNSLLPFPLLLLIFPFFYYFFPSLSCIVSQVTAALGWGEKGQTPSNTLFSLVGASPWRQNNSSWWILASDHCNFVYLLPHPPKSFYKILYINSHLMLPDNHVRYRVPMIKKRLEVLPSLGEAGDRFFLIPQEKWEIHITITFHI